MAASHVAAGAPDPFPARCVIASAAHLPVGLGRPVNLREPAADAPAGAHGLGIQLASSLRAQRRKQSTCARRQRTTAAGAVDGGVRQANRRAGLPGAGNLQGLLDVGERQQWRDALGLDRSGRLGHRRSGRVPRVVVRILAELWRARRQALAVARDPQVGRSHLTKRQPLFGERERVHAPVVPNEALLRQRRRPGEHARDHRREEVSRRAVLQDNADGRAALRQREILGQPQLLKRERIDPAGCLVFHVVRHLRHGGAVGPSDPHGPSLCHRER
eukprot:1797145-Prymnesium_polylepis.1